jgi:hypothetical protein
VHHGHDAFGLWWLHLSVRHKCDGLTATNASTQPCTQRKRGAVDIACALASELAAPDEDRFVADNFALLKASGLMEAGVPAELGAATQMSTSWPRC